MEELSRRSEFAIVFWLGALGLAGFMFVAHDEHLIRAGFGAVLAAVAALACSRS
jgi:hypothetical protein